MLLRGTLTILALAATSAEQVPSCDDLETFDTAESLPTVDGRLIGHWLLVPAGCMVLSDEAREELLPRTVGIATGALATALGLQRGECSTAACLSTGSPVEMLPAGAKRKPWSEAQPLEQWVDANCQVVVQGFVKMFDEPVRIEWSGDDEKPAGVTGGPQWRRDGSLPLEKHQNTSTCLYRQEQWFLARLGESFQIFAEADDRLVMNRTVDFDGANVIGMPPPHDESMPSWRDWDPLIEQTWDDNLYRKSLIQRNFSRSGFRVSDVPPSVMAEALTYHHNNQHELVPEEWNPWLPDGGVAINFWEAPSYIIPTPQRLKNGWAAALQAQIADWVGGEVETQFNALYGMRVYTENSVLFAHVDKASTHALSLVVNIAQEGVREPWPIELDCAPVPRRSRKHAEHAQMSREGKVPGATLEPGKILFYESARCLHGRARRMQGKSFTNMFAHFSPKGQPNWYDKDPLKWRATSRLKAGPEGATTAAKPRVAASVNMKNEASSPCEAWWQPPPSFGSTDEVLVATIKAGESLTFSGAISDVYKIRGACNETVTIINTGDNFYLCLTALEEQKWKKRQSASVASYADGAFGLFRNLGSQTVTLWTGPTKARPGERPGAAFLKQLSQKGAPGTVFGMGERVAPGKHLYITAPKYTVYCVVAQGDSRGCAAALDVIILQHPDSPDGFYFSFDDGTGDEQAKAAWEDEKRAGLEYKVRTGRDWIIPKEIETNVPMDRGLHTHLPTAIGEERVVTTSHGPFDTTGDMTIRMTALSMKPNAWLVQDFLTAEEADQLVAMGGDRIKPSTVAAGSNVAERTSRNTWLDRGSSNLTELVSRRAADVLGVDEDVMRDAGAGALTEKYQLVQYRPGQWYAAHTDWTVDLAASGGRLRFCTLLMYLNTPEGAGGGTAFPLADTPGQLVTEPRKGSALLFYNLLPDGNADVHSLHMGLPVQAGEKWVANLWVGVRPAVGHR